MRASLQSFLAKRVGDIYTEPRPHNSPLEGGQGRVARNVEASNNVSSCVSFWKNLPLQWKQSNAHEGDAGTGGIPYRRATIARASPPPTLLKGRINRRHCWNFLCLFTCFALPFNSSAQENPPSLVQVQRAYEALKFEEAERLGRLALEHGEEYSAGELVQLHLIMGYLGYLHQQPEVARNNFESALSLQPDLTLDSLLVSPKIVRMFEQVKNEYRVGLSSGKPAIKYVMIKDQRLGALRRSLLLPGWGQRHLRQHTRGALYTTGFLLAVGAGLAFQVAQSQAHRSYLDASTPSQITRRYDIYNQRYRVRNAAFIAAGSIWAINLLEVLLVTPSSPPGAVSSSKAFELNLRIPF